MDERLTNIKAEQEKALQDSKNMYTNLQNENKQLYDQQMDTLNQTTNILNDTLDKQLANQTQKIEQQKEVARQNKEIEEKKALNDYTAFTNPYGYQAEALASQGLTNSGLSETTKLGGFNTYQNRLASANKVMQDAITTYDMEINDAILNNDVQKAQNALNKLNQTLVYQESYYSNKATITQNQANAERDINNDYFTRYQTEYQNIQNELAAAEAKRQFEAKLAEEQRQFNALNNISKSSTSTSTSSNKNASTNKTTSSGVDANGNSTETQKKSDYYFDNNQNQPRYVNNIKLTDTGIKAGELGTYLTSIGIPSTNKIWKAGNKYYVWVNKSVGTYMDITAEMEKRNKALVNNAKTVVSGVSSAAKEVSNALSNLFKIK